MIEKRKEIEQKKLFDFIDSVQVQMDELKALFFQKWNSIIKEHLEVDEDFRIERYVDICGGYWLEESLYVRMDFELKKFYDKRIKKKNGRVFLRGYDYYKIDPLMHRQRDLHDWNNLWGIFQEKWVSYQGNYTFNYLRCNHISIENWLGILGLLEYIFTDLTSLQWFAFKNREKLLYKIGDTYFSTVREMEIFTEIIGKTIACVLKFDFTKAYLLLSETYASIIGSELLSNLICVKLDLADKSSVRTIREGDSICLIYASYLMKLEPFCKKKHLKKIQLVSNAFGAMNIGIILKYLISPYSEVSSYNILYAQNRAVEDAVYGEPLSDLCCIIGEKQETVIEESQAVFIVDDSIFSGNSYSHIKNFLYNKRLVYLLPLTLNCDCIKYCRRGIKETDDMNQIAHQAVTWAAEVGDLFPAFSSFWDFCREASENKILTDNIELRSVLDGDDLLTKHLWAIFESEIFTEE